MSVTLAAIWAAPKEQLIAALKHAKMVYDEKDINGLRFLVALLYAERNMLTPDSKAYAKHPAFTMVLKTDLATSLNYMYKKSHGLITDTLTEKDVVASASWPQVIPPNSPPDPDYTGRTLTISEMKEYWDADHTMIVDGPRYVGSGAEIFNKMFPTELKHGKWYVKSNTGASDVLAYHESVVDVELKYVRYTAPNEYVGFLSDEDYTAEIKTILSDAKMKTLEEALSNRDNWHDLSDKSYVEEVDGESSFYMYMSSNKDAVLLTSDAVLMSLPWK